MPELSEEQQNILDRVAEGNNILVTGPAGTGKSFLMDHLKEIFRENDVRFAVTASTGAAAANINGSTLHSWAGLGLATGSFEKILQTLRYNLPAVKRIQGCQVLIIDEVSMVPADLLDTMDKLFRQIRGLDLPFGGIQMLFVGDFAQLRPVKGEFCFKAESWSEAGVISMQLTHIFRQSDAEFARALNQMRLGRMDESSKKLILTRYQAIDPDPKILPVSIVSTNAEAKRINDTELEKLSDPGQIFRASDRGARAPKKFEWDLTPKYLPPTPAAEKMLSKMTIPAELHLKVGARVVCLQNLPLLGLVNGSAGTVSSLDEGVFVNFDGEGEVKLLPFTREIIQDDKVIASRTQYPLKLGWALTSHSVQGMTLNKVAIHMAGAFEPAQTYVAMSRVKTLDGLFIRSLNKANIGCHPDALAFYTDHDDDDFI